MKPSRPLFERSLVAVEWGTIAAGAVMTFAVLWQHERSLAASIDEDSVVVKARSACEPNAKLTTLGQLHAWLDGADLPASPATPAPKLDAALAARGAPLFAQHCATCHGAKGAGDGPLTASLMHPVTSFASGVFELRSTEHEALPTDLDLFRAITHGVHGTGMPPWFALPEADRWALVAFVKTLTPDFADDTAPDPIAANPPVETSDRIDHGAQLYMSAGCASCHGVSGVGDGPAAAALVFKNGAPAHPRSFRSDRFHRGARVSDIYMTISSGLDGSPMGSFAKVMSPDDLWDVAMYVHSMAPKFVELPNGLSCSTPREANPDEMVGIRALVRSLHLTK